MRISAAFFTVEPQTVQLVFLALVRVSGALLVAPPFQQPMIPAQVKLAIGGALLLCAWPSIEAARPALAPDVTSLLSASALEAIVGTTIGFVGRFALAAASVAAELVSVQMGLGIASQLDPINGAQVTVLTRLYDWTVVMLFLFLDAHYLILRALVDSFQLVPLGGAALGTAAASAVVPLGARIFSMALSLVAPILGILFIGQLVLVLAARAVPQLNLMSVGIPIMLGLGLLVLLLTFDLSQLVVAREISAMPELLSATVRGFSRGR